MSYSWHIVGTTLNIGTNYKLCNASEVFILEIYTGIKFGCESYNTMRPSFDVRYIKIKYTISTIKFMLFYMNK